METIFAPTNHIARASGLMIDTQAAFCTDTADALFDAGLHAAERQLDTLRTLFASATVDASSLIAGLSRQWLGAVGWEGYSPVPPLLHYPSHGGFPQSLAIGMALASVSSPELAADSGGMTR